MPILLTKVRQAGRKNGIHYKKAVLTQTVRPLCDQNKITRIKALMPSLTTLNGWRTLHDSPWTK